MDNDILRKFFHAITLFGSPLFYAPATAYVFSINLNLAINLIVILILTEVVCAAIKYLYPKERPIPMPKKTLFQRYLAGSFPSVHTARITSFSIAAAAYYPNRIFVLIAFLAIISVGYSRIYLKKHYLADVLAGFLIAAIISVLELNIQNYLNLY
ncbi:phosphatase PAP2 family protein [Candidatus Woesearchaeota archaeon]|nr:phosphatase PAP2 family protein [Candidatus Woesearchaeota archaeon]